MASAVRGSFGGGNSISIRKAASERRGPRTEGRFRRLAREKDKFPLDGQFCAHWPARAAPLIFGFKNSEGFFHGRRIERRDEQRRKAATNEERYDDQELRRLQEVQVAPLK